MDKTLTIATAPKTTTFQIRINPEIKAQLEDIYADCGMTLTDAINAFLQQSLNTQGLPFLMTKNSKESLRVQAAAMLMSEIQAGLDTVTDDAAWVSAEDIRAEFGR